MKKPIHKTSASSINSSGSKSLIPVSIVYFLGAFNDNFYKQAAMLIAVSSGLTQNQGYAVTIFTLPFLLFAAPAGWLADRIQKRKVIIISKWAELFAMLSGAAGLITGSWPLIFIMLAIMATQTTVFSPAVNGYLPDLFPEEKIVRVNGILRMIVTTAILSGIALAGPALDSRVFG
ncbi:MAG TPA: MFS transporter, partial [Spirochaetota bacterium]|nr:MFS transporter [Spirochaetota bacterium]